MNVDDCPGEKARKEAGNELLGSGEISRKKYGREATTRREDNEGEKGGQCWRRAFGGAAVGPPKELRGLEVHVRMSGSRRERAQGRKAAPPAGGESEGVRGQRKEQVETEDSMLEPKWRPGEATGSWARLRPRHVQARSAPPDVRVAVSLAALRLRAEVPSQGPLLFLFFTALFSLRSGPLPSPAWWPVCFPLALCAVEWFAPVAQVVPGFAPAVLRVSIFG